MSAPTAFTQYNLLSPGQVAEKLGVHRSTVWQYIETGQLASYFVATDGSLKPTFLNGQRTSEPAHYRGVRPRDLETFRRNYLQMPRPDSAVPSKVKRSASPRKKQRKRAATNKR